MICIYFSDDPKGPDVCPPPPPGCSSCNEITKPFVDVKTADKNSKDVHEGDQIELHCSLVVHCSLEKSVKLKW